MGSHKQGIGASIDNNTAWYSGIGGQEWNALVSVSAMKVLPSVDECSSGEEEQTQSSSMVCQHFEEVFVCRSCRNFLTSLGGERGDRQRVKFIDTTCEQQTQNLLTND
eukprot:gene10478-2609_t